MNKRDELNKNGLMLRYVCTFITLPLIFFFFCKQNLRRYLFLTIPIILSLLDGIDNIFSFQYTVDCCNNAYYKTYDKICDSFSYVWTYLMFLYFLKGDSWLLFFIVYRIIGVSLFSFTKNGTWFVVFFDFVKEYIFYRLFFGKNLNYIPLFILVKIGVECYLHVIKSTVQYT
jgi:hypothetical protein